jgi:uncharacterized surface protein with fasciclin (FAS1) repeats
MHRVYRFLSLILAISLIFTTAAVVAAQDTPPATPTPMAEEEVGIETGDIDIVDAARAAPNLQTLVTALEAANLAETLSGPGPFTVFAPTDEAFAALPAGALNDLLADPEGALTNVLLNHVVSGEVMSMDLSDGMTVETLGGAPLTITVNDDGVMVNDANVVVADLMTSNGVVHVIDAVLQAPAPETAPETTSTEADEDETMAELLQEFTPSIQVRDQVFSVRDDQTSVVVPELFATENAWVVIHRDDNGAPGEVIGNTFVEAGPNYEIEVALSGEIEGDIVLWAMLHTDAGEAGTYEFPGADAPVELNGEIVMAQFVALEPGIVISEQTLMDNTVTADAVVTAADSWLVIHRSQDGAPGEVIGFAPVAPGVTPNVRVELSGDVSNEETLWAMLHYDLGTRGEYEFPGEDVPITLQRGVVMNWFVVYTDGAQAETAAAADATATPTAEVEEATPTPTAAAEMAAPAATATPTMDAMSPDMLPVTGASLAEENNSALPWMVLILGVMIAAGIVIFRRRLA